MSFVVVEFIGEGSVEVVCSEWIEKCNEVWMLNNCQLWFSNCT